MPSLPCLITEHAKVHFNQKNFRFLMSNAMMGSRERGEEASETEVAVVEDVERIDPE